MFRESLSGGDFSFPIGPAVFGPPLTRLGGLWPGKCEAIVAVWGSSRFPSTSHDLVECGPVEGPCGARTA